MIAIQLEQDSAQTPSITPDHRPNEEHSPHQHIRFNLLWHRGVISDIPTLQLFKEFVTVLWLADPMLTILPYESSKQHYSSISTSKQIQVLNAQKLHTFFRSYYQKQHYSLSGYFHIRMALTFDEMIPHEKVMEWLDVYYYYMKLCPSQQEEMIPIGALCYSNVFMHCKELKQAIMKSVAWNRSNFSAIFDIYISDLIGKGKKTKMLFVSSEKSKYKEATEFFKMLYDGSPKAYPNGSMMLFIPLRDGAGASSDYREKNSFNHDKYNGDEETVCIGGLQDLDSKITLATGKSITIRELLKSYPASPGMSRPVLFQHVENNSSGQEVIVSYQKADPLVKLWQAALERDGEIEKVFLDDVDGMWFGSVFKN